MTTTLDTPIPPTVPTWTPPEDGRPRAHWCAEGCGPFTFHEAVSHGIAHQHGLHATRSPK